MLVSRNSGKLNYTTIILLVLANFIFGCSNGLNNSFEAKIVKQAPQRNQDAGWVVKVEDSDSLKQLVMAIPEAKIRVLYKPKNIYEVFGVTKKRTRRKYSI